MTHNDLILRGIRWLKNSLHCRVVISELVAYTKSGEIPDAIGWVHNRCILIECKTSLSNFYADRRKRSRWDGFPALGHWRFYLTPPSLIVKPPRGWGVYEVHSKRILHTGGVRYANAAKPPFESCRDSEIALLLSQLSRLNNL